MMNRKEKSASQAQTGESGTPILTANQIPNLGQLPAPVGLEWRPFLRSGRNTGSQKYGVDCIQNRANNRQYFTDKMSLSGLFLERTRIAH
jgi:hypothetical protein